jgi:RHS repeat-associated protein
MWKDPSGLYYVRARVYDSETGRFTSRDPVRGAFKRPESLVPFAFANHAPTMYLDPDGLTSVISVSVAIVANSILSAIVTGGVQHALTGRVSTSDVVVSAVFGAIGGLGLGATGLNLTKSVLFSAELNVLQATIGRQVNGDTVPLESLMWAALAGGVGGLLGAGFQLPPAPRVQWSNNGLFANSQIRELAREQLRLHALEISLAVVTSARNILALLLAGVPDYQVDRGMPLDPS